MELKKGPRVGGWTSLLIAHASLAWLPLEAARGRSAFPQTGWSLWKQEDSDLGGCLSSVPSQMSGSE